MEQGTGLEPAASRLEGTSSRVGTRRFDPAGERWSLPMGRYLYIFRPIRRTASRAEYQNGALLCHLAETQGRSQLEQGVEHHGW